jgi:hypothetical protein
VRSEVRHNANIRPSHWTHERAHFFKYVSSETAQAILHNRNLRWSAVSCFNDPFDGQFNLQLQFNNEEVVQAVLERHWDVLSGVRHSSAKNKLGALLNFAASRLGSKLTKEQFLSEMRAAVEQGIHNGNEQVPLVHQAIREVLADFKFLCLTERHDSILMWSHYAQHHTGAVFRFSCQPQSDSLWGVAKPVKYPREMPRLMNQGQFIDLLSGDFSLETHLTLDSIVFTKADEWSYEKEWRVAMPGTNSKEQWQCFRFDASELSAVYFGCNMHHDAKETIKALINRHYPETEIWAAQKSTTEFALEFEQIR